jgi:hypothetical protein
MRYVVALRTKTHMFVCPDEGEVRKFETNG